MQYLLDFHVTEQACRQAFASPLSEYFCLAGNECFLPHVRSLARVAGCKTVADASNGLNLDWASDPREFASDVRDVNLHEVSIRAAPALRSPEMIDDLAKRGDPTWAARDSTSRSWSAKATWCW